MWSRNPRCLVLILFLFLLVNCSAIEISEVELNPVGDDSGNEWVELYSNEEVDLEGYKLINNDGDEINLEGSFEDYFVYRFEKQWLDNSDERIFLYEGGDEIDKTDVLEDGENNGLTWSYCDDWTFREGTKDKENDCVEEVEEVEEVVEEIDSVVEEVVEESVEEIIYESEEVVSEEVNYELSKETIYLAPQNIKSEENVEIIFKSKNQMIKEYAIYGFALFCVVMIIFLIRNRL